MSRMTQTPDNVSQALRWYFGGGLGCAMLSMAGLGLTHRNLDPAGSTRLGRVCQSIGTLRVLCVTDGGFFFLSFFFSFALLSNSGGSTRFPSRSIHRICVSPSLQPQLIGTLGSGRRDHRVPGDHGNIREATSWRATLKAECRRARCCGRPKGAHG